ncbi:MAG TPA: hypothetical protein VHA75_06030 [Rugosimonospora sp.]|nr:hypothetical protein [Rugosimonospora sp.]
MPTETLTPRQRRILGAITGHIAEHGYPPSVRQIGAVADLSTPSAVAHQLRELTRKGYIRRDPSVPRGISVVGDDPRPYKVTFLDRPGLAMSAFCLDDVVWILRQYRTEERSYLWESDEDPNLWTTDDGLVSVTYAPDRRSA